MFDHFHITPSNNTTKYVPYEKTVTVTENRAVTDDSARLYGELLDKARASLLDQFTVSSSLLGELQIQIHADLLGHSYLIFYSFLLNNENIYGKVKVPVYALDEMDNWPEVLHALSSAVSRNIIAKLEESLKFSLGASLIDFRRGRGC